MLKLRHLAALAFLGCYLMVRASPYAQANTPHLRVFTPECDQQMEMRAGDDVTTTLKTWQLIHESFLRYRECDRGEIWEGYSYSVMAMLADRWGQLSSLQTVIAQDDPFREFVFKHID